MSPIVAAFLRSTLLPSVLFGVVLLVTGGNGEPMKARVQALAFAVLYALGAYLLIDRIAFPPADVSESLIYAGLLLALFVVIAPKGVGPRYALRAVVVLAGMFILLHHIRESLMANAVNHRNLLAFFCLSLGIWSVAERSARHVATSTLSLLALVSAAGTSLILLFGASASFSQLVTILCGLLGATTAVSLLFPKRVSPGAILPFASVFVTFFMLAGHFYLDVNPWKMVALAWPYLILWIRPWIPGLKHPVAEGAVFGLMAALPVGYFVYTAFQAAGPLY